MGDGGVSRRGLLAGLAGGVGVGVAAGCSSSVSHASAAISRRSGSTTTTIGKRALRTVGSRPYPDRAEGSESLPKIEHIVIYMQENHSFDNLYGMLGRGDGYTFRKGKPTNAIPDLTGKPTTVFPMTGTCDLTDNARQSWDATHISIDGGAMDGFIRAGGGPGCMGYWDGDSLPFYYGLAKTFPICDRWFTSAPCQTFPNRRFLQAATSLGVISTSIPDIQATPVAPNGIIWDRLNSHGITWNNYVVDLADILLFPTFEAANRSHEKTIPDFLRDCAAGTLPQVSLVSPGVVKYTEEDPNDVQLGEALSARVINAVLQSPAWEKTAMFFTYDEHGGYYDHVPPPAAVPPDTIAPRLQPSNQPGSFDRYGPRVPGFVISPFAKKDYVSHVVHDHTSILKFIETKFNLGAMTNRDANADNLLDSFDFSTAAFREPPTLPKPGLPPTGSTCESTKFPDPATIQPSPA